MTAQAHGINDPIVAKGIENLAALYRVTNRENEAAQLEQRVAAIRAIKQ